MLKNIHFCEDIAADYRQNVYDFIDEWHSESEFIIVHTSGSTGTPKQIKLPKQKVRASAIATGSFFGFNTDSKLFLTLSPNYIAGKLMIVRALVHNATLIVGPLNQNPLAHLSELDVDFAAFVPYQVKAILEDDKTRAKFEQIKDVIIGGAPINYLLEQKLQSCSNQTYATFGMTETITHFALRSITNKEAHYTCLPGFEIATNKEGALILEANPITDRIETTDYIELIDNHRFKWLGRLDNIVNSGGIKLSPELIEKKMQPFIEQRFYVIGETNDKFGEQLVMYIEGEKSHNDLEEIFQQLNNTERPKEIRYVSAFKETATGKVIRALL